MFSAQHTAPDCVTVGGSALACAPRTPARHRNVTVAFRPEQVKLHTTQTQGENCLSVTVIDRETRGAIDRIYLSSPVLEGELCADLWSGEPILSTLAPGQQITMQVPAHAVVILDEDQP